MTTAARPTFEPARGGTSRGEKDLSAISKQYSSRDLPSHTKLKSRETGQGTVDELRSRDFRRELEERERSARGGDKRTSSSSSSSAGGTSGSSRSRPAREPLAPANLDADDPPDEDGSDEDEDSDDDEAELLAELQRIRKERAADAVKREAEKKAEEERIRMENILSGNPLLNYAASAAKADAKVKRRWDDDVVFKNCARSEPDRKQARFINDALRNDFHKKFMDKYIK